MSRDWLTPEEKQLAAQDQKAEIGRLTADLNREKIVRIELMALIAKLRTALERIDYYYKLNDCDQMAEYEAIEIDIKAMREIHRTLANEQDK